MDITARGGRQARLAHPAEGMGDGRASAYHANSILHSTRNTTEESALVEELIQTVLNVKGMVVEDVSVDDSPLRPAPRAGSGAVPEGGTGVRAAGTKCPFCLRIESGQIKQRCCPHFAKAPTIRRELMHRVQWRTADTAPRHIGRRHRSYHRRSHSPLTRAGQAPRACSGYRRRTARPGTTRRRRARPGCAFDR